MTTLTPPAGGEAMPLVSTRSEGVADCLIFAQEYSGRTRLAGLVGAALVGAAGAAFTARIDTQANTLPALFLGFSFVGGLLSTWSPCGYSSLCLLRPVGRHARSALVTYTPTFLLHGAGYALGAVILGVILGLAGGLLGFPGASVLTLAGLGLAGLVYGAHQFGFLRVPYPQRRAQVPHDARQRFPMWFIGGLYGISLGLNYLTYVQTPILYLVTAAAVASGNVTSAVVLFLAFNAGRFLPMAVNYLPVSDIAVQNWLARRQESAAFLDGGLLIAFGAALLTFAVL
ncbi:methylamine utilization protein MauF [Methylorubrum populi]|uniref:methylamine utilization protein MauF n=1 Tax=Methylorubrum populi TaxID=223967 RepID=UPI00129C475C|nr:methylamine utilization protein MauF [Methylorubrum populi]